MHSAVIGPARVPIVLDPKCNENSAAGQDWLADEPKSSSVASLLKHAARLGRPEARLTATAVISSQGHSEDFPHVMEKRSPQ